MKKKIIILATAFLLLIIFFSYYFFWVKRENPEATIRDAFPFGRDSDFVPPVEDDPREDQRIGGGDLAMEGRIPNLRMISSEPTAGGIAFQDNSGTRIRFIERAGGNIFETGTETLETRKIAESQVPIVYEAYWVNKNSVLTRTLRSNLETVESRYLILKEEDTGLPFFFNTELRRGDTGLAVRELQRLLNQDPDTQVAQTGAGSPGNETNIFAEATENAVKKFQEKYASEILDPQNLEEGTGIVNSLTRAKLNDLSGWNNYENQERELLNVEGRILEIGAPGIAGISDLAISPNGESLFLLKTNQAGSEGFVYNLNNHSEAKVFSSPLKEWLVEWPSPERIALTTKPSNDIMGYSYLLNRNNGNLNRTLGNIEGLATLFNPNSSKVLYAQVSRRTWNLNIYDITSGSTLNFSNLRTFPEKCVWSRENFSIAYCAVPSAIPSGTLPDAWYQGAVSFSDNLWKINAETGETTLVSDLSDYQTIDSFDIVDPFLDPKEEFIFFTNKKDLSLWSIRIANN